jgi:hypothetical protein
MIQILLGTPIWVYPLFILTIWLGVSAARQSTRDMMALLRLPLIFLVWSIASLLMGSNTGMFAILIWLGGASLGAGVGYTLFRTANLVLNAEGGRSVIVPGTWFTLIFSVTIFAINYLFGYLRATAPELLLSAPYFIMMPAISGVSSGVFVGQTAAYARKYIELKRQHA